MAIRKVFLDTSGLFALFCKTDAYHSSAIRIIADKAGLFTTTDAVVGETCTLFISRGRRHLSSELFRLLETTKTIELVYVDSERFWRTRDFLLKHLDQDFSFVDCASFVVMRELQLSDALTSDTHFRAVGYRPLLVPG